MCFYGSDPSCSLNAINSSVWMQKNLGGFSVVIPFQDLQILYPQFSPVLSLMLCLLYLLICLFLWLIQSSLSLWISADGSPITAVTQTASSVVCHTWTVNLSRSGQHGDEPDPQPASTCLLRWLLICNCGEWSSYLQTFLFRSVVAFNYKYFLFSLFLQGQANTLPSPVRSALLQVVFDRVNLTDSSVSDSVVTLWLSKRLPPLLLNLSQLQVAPLFTIWTGRNCSIGQQGYVYCHEDGSNHLN